MPTSWPGCRRPSWIVTPAPAELDRHARADVAAVGAEPFVAEPVAQQPAPAVGGRRLEHGPGRRSEKPYPGSVPYSQPAPAGWSGPEVRRMRSRRSVEHRLVHGDGERLDRDPSFIGRPESTRPGTGGCPGCREALADFPTVTSRRREGPR
jgi:hypothetical protein